MKKIILLFAILISVVFSYAYEWEPIGPPSIKANKICVISNSDYDVYAFITVDTGMYIVSDWYPYEGEFYNLPIVDACRIDFGYPTADSVIVIINEGSYSDGIYSFHLETHETHLIEFCYKPNFIKAWDYGSKYYVGYEGGLLISEDGYNWEPDPMFDQMNCTSISQCINNVDNIIVITENQTDNAFLLDENGQTWYPIFSDFKIIEAFDEYGICRDDGFGGLYELYFTGQTYLWNEKFDSDSLNCIGGSNTGNAFVGWHSSEEDDEGIAEIKVNSFQFKNEGLPCVDINHITADPQIVGGEVILCCTDDGAFRLDDTTTGMDDLDSNQGISVFPNPVNSSESISILCPEIDGMVSIKLFSNSGKLILEKSMENQSNSIIQLVLPEVETGIYYLHLNSDVERMTKKVIIK